MRLTPTATGGTLWIRVQPTDRCRATATVIGDRPDDAGTLQLGLLRVVVPGVTPAWFDNKPPTFLDTA